ncbi:MAG: enoyl-CoA hydratase-related protein, partial [Pseudomonadales bacterium]|nr:enoyl-CoA hydratase-related protein [Pseudomonadales bacterium]
MTTIDTGTESLLCDVEDSVATITMNRPEARNAMDSEMMPAMATVLSALELDNDVRCIVVTGAGKGFCAGGDVKAMASRGDAKSGPVNTIDQGIHAQRDSQRGSVGKLFKIPKPTIASLPGAAAGAGLGIALSCDFRIMASNAIMTTAFAKVGFSGDYGGTYFMTHLVGVAKARELYMLSD